MTLAPTRTGPDFAMYYCPAEALMDSLADDSVNLIAIDPPYFKVKAEAWDRQWDKSEEFLAWLGGDILRRCQRVLAPNGSLYVCASPQMAWSVEGLVRERFDVLNSIRWQKDLDRGKHAACCKETLRGYFPNTETILFAEQRGSDSMAMGESGYEAECERLRGFVFEPLRAYIAGEFERAGMLTTAGKIAANVACGFSATSGGMAARHYFSRSQWWLPTPEHYAALRELLNRSGGEYLRREYEDLRREYEDLRREYEDLRREYEDLRREYEDLRKDFEALRRPFTVSADVPYTDVWTFPTVAKYPGKHVCEKPLAMMQHIVRSSSRPGDLVADFFAGSGSTGRAALTLGRKFVGCDIDAHWVNRAAESMAGLALDPTATLEGNAKAPAGSQLALI